MADTVIGAVQEYYDSLTFTGKPPVLWFGRAELRLPDNTPTTYPVIEYYDEGAPYLGTFEGENIESRTVRFEVFSPLLSEVQSICDEVLFGGASSGSRDGLNMPSTFVAVTGYTFLESMIMSYPTVRRLEIQDRNVSQLHYATFTVRLTYTRN